MAGSSLLHEKFVLSRPVRWIFIQWHRLTTMLRRLGRDDRSVHFWSDRLLDPTGGGLNLIGGTLSLLGLAGAIFAVRESLTALFYQLVDIVRLEKVENTLGAIVAVIAFTMERGVRRRRYARAQIELARVGISPNPQFQPATITLSESYTNAGYKVANYCHGVGCWSPKISQWLSCHSHQSNIKLLVETSVWEGDRDALAVLEPKRAIGLINEGKTFSNDVKVRVKFSPFLDFPPKLDMIVEQTTYVVMLCTSDMVSQVAVGQSGSMLAKPYTPWSFLLDDAEHLRRFDSIELANQLGSSSLVFTRDDYLILVEQKGTNIQSSNLIAPSGSGSFDWSDVANSDGADFVVWAKQAAKREFLEETGLEAIHCGKRIRVDLLPIGFGLYLHRGAKPELFFLGQVDLDKKQFERLQTYSSSEAKLSKLWTFENRFRLPDGEWSAAAIVTVLDAVRSAYKDRLSMPLEMAIEMAQSVCMQSPTQIDGLVTSPAAAAMRLPPNQPVAQN